MASKDSKKAANPRNPPTAFASRSAPSVRLPPLEERLRRVAEDIAMPASMRERVLAAIGAPIHGPDDPRVMRYVERLLAAVEEPIRARSPIHDAPRPIMARGDARSRSPRDRAARGLSITRVLIKTSPQGETTTNIYY